MVFPTGSAASCLVLLASQLSSGAVGLQVKRETEVCKTVVHETYSGDDVLIPGWYQEPERMLDAETWDDLRFDLDGAYPKQGVTSQAVRIPTLTKLYAVLPPFFNAVFPGGIWHLEFGSLLGAMRTGAVMAWDMDGDIAVDGAGFITARTMDLLEATYGEPIAYSTSKECLENAYLGRCPVWSIAEGVLFATLPLDKHPTYHFLSRFIDRRTGYFLEIAQGPVANLTTQFSVYVTLLPVPQEPSAEEWLVSNYFDVRFPLNRQVLARELYECRCPAEHFKVPVWQQDSFDVMVMQQCGAGEGSPWDLALVDTAAACCRPGQDASIPDNITMRWHAPGEA